MEQNKIDYFNINLNFKNLIFLLNQIIKGKSYMRATHNLFLKKKINVKSPIANIGSGKKNEYMKFICEDETLVKNYDFFNLGKNVKKIDLEKRFILKKNLKV